MLKKTWNILKKCLAAAGIGQIIIFSWIITGCPIVFDRLLIQAQEPIEADCIICLTAGVTRGELLPGEDGWRRIYAAVQLYFDGYGKKIVFTGGGREKVSEAEIYAEAAQWLGCPDSAILIEPSANRTAEHPLKLLAAKELAISRETPLNIVTTSLHSRRAALCFRKAGYRKFRIVTEFAARKTSETDKIRTLRTSSFGQFSPAKKGSNNLFNHMTGRLDYFLSALKEAAAIILYKTQGLI